MPVGLLVEKDTCFIPMHSFILTLVTFKTVFARGHRYVRLIRHTLTFTQRVDLCWLRKKD